MAKTSAGILLWKRERDAVRVLLVHPGGPFWKNKDAGAWSIPKGEYLSGEEPLAAAKREFAEELGLLPGGEIAPLGEVKQRGGKIVTGFALQADFDCSTFKCNNFEMEWPPRSGRMQRYPEADDARWMTLAEARRMMLPSQLPMLDALEAKLKE